MRTRFAPSPTGYIHIGNVRSAIYPYLLAQQQGGDFILRIEDTDQARFVEGATELIEDVMKWLGLDWTEGPIVGGDHGPYFQSQRKEIYLKWVRNLLVAGEAYFDNTPPETIQAYREKCNQEKVPFLYRNFRPESADKQMDEEITQWFYDIREGRNPNKYVVRFKANPRDYNWHDEVYGDLHAPAETQDDIVLIKADGMPTYNFAHIVDDSTMGVTHIFRGQEYLPSMGNYLALYDAFGIEWPVFVHLPHILATNGNKKLGKRDGAKSVTEYREDGVLPEAMLNYLANLGWNDGTEQEIYSKEEMIEKFSLDKIQKAGARYDEVKLLWMNGQWIRKIYDEQGVDALYARTEGFWPEVAQDATEAEKKEVLSIIYDRLKTLKDLETMTSYFFAEPEVDLDMILNNKILKKLSEMEIANLLQKSVEKLQDTEWNEDSIQEALNSLLVQTEQKPAVLFSAVRIAVSFAPFSPALNLTLKTLGKAESLARMQKVIVALNNN